MGEQGLLTRVQAYRRLEGARDPDPITYAQELALSWIAAVRIAGCQGIFLAGNLNVTWTTGESEGQRTIHTWCDAHFLINGPKLINASMSTPFITHGHCDGGRASGMDYSLHTGNPEHVCIDGACNALGE